MAVANVDGNILRAEEEKLNVVGFVVDGQALGVASTRVASLLQDFDCRLGQRSLVGHGNTQHGVDFSYRYL